MHWRKFRDILILILHESLIFLYQGIKLRSRQFRWTLSLTYFVFSFADGLHYSLVSLMVLREIVIFNGKLTALKLFVIKEKLLESNLKPKRKSDLIKVMYPTIHFLRHAKSCTDLFTVFSSNFRESSDPGERVWDETLKILSVKLCYLIES